jgi:hypothetical protein
MWRLVARRGDLSENRQSKEVAGGLLLQTVSLDLVEEG